MLFPTPDAISRTVFDQVYPVGSVVVRTDAVDPATLFGGSWVQIGSGQVMVGQDANQAEFAALGQTGGAKTHTHAPGTLAASSHTGTAVADHPAHTHAVTPAGTVAWPAGVPTFAGTALTDTTKAASGSTSVALLASPKTPAGTIAWPAGVPTFAGGSVTTGNPNATLTHAVTQPADHTFSGATAAGSSLQPYLVVRFWQRTA